MTMEQVLELLRMNSILYKQSEKPLTDAEIKTMSSVWYYHFKNYPGDVVKRAFLAANAVCKFPVQPADIFVQLKAMARENQIPQYEAWARLKDCLKKARAYESRKEFPLFLGIDPKTGEEIESDGRKELNDLFGGLPDYLKKFFGTQAGMMTFANLSDEDLERRRRPEFLKFYEEISSNSEKTLMIGESQRPELASKNK